MAISKTKPAAKRKAAKKVVAKKAPVKRAPLTKKAAAEKKLAVTDGKQDIAASYNSFKEYQGQQYTGMKIGRSHKWYYDKGEWKEKKVTLAFTPSKTNLWL